MNVPTNPKPILPPYKAIRWNHPNPDWPWPKVEPKVHDTLLKGVVNSDDRLESAITTAQEVNALYLDYIQGQSTPADFLWFLWELVTRGFAAKLPWDGVHQGRLVNVLKALRTLPDPIDTDLGDWGTFKVWADLPLLGPVSMENWNSYDFDSEEGRNMGGFVARLTQEEIVDFSWMGLCAFHQALETKPSRRSKRLKKQGAEADAFVPLTLVWLQLAGKKLYEMTLAGSLEDKEEPNEPNEMGGNWKGKAGYSKERWEFWKKRYRQLAEHPQPSRKTKGLCRKALEMMDGLESFDSVGSTLPKIQS